MFELAYNALTMKLKNAKTIWWNGAAGFGIDPPLYVSLARFSNVAETLGVKTTGIGKGPFGSGCKLTLSGGNRGRVYELLASEGRILLGELKNGGTRLPLASGTDTAAGWQRLLQALEISEGGGGRLSA